MLHRSKQRNRAPGGPGESITQLRYAREGRIIAEMRRVAEREQEEAETIRDEVARGRMIIPANVRHTALDAMCVGKNSRVKINANIGNSRATFDIEAELEKLRSRKTRKSPVAKVHRRPPRPTEGGNF